MGSAHGVVALSGLLVTEVSIPFACKTITHLGNSYRWLWVLVHTFAVAYRHSCGYHTCDSTKALQETKERRRSTK